MDENSQRRMEPHQRQLMDRQQHGGPWFDPPPPNSFQQFQRHVHQHQVSKWCGYDHPSTHYAHPPLLQYSVQQDYWMPQLQHASSLQQQTQVRHEQSRHPGQTYGRQQEKAWRSSNGCNQSHLSQQGSSTGSDEEDWAAKARAWASAKASEEVAQQALQPIPLQTAVLEQGQTCEESLKAVQHAPGITHLSSSLQPWQERAQVFSHDASASFGQGVQPYAQAPLPTFVQEEIPPSFGRNASLHLSQVGQEEMVSTSHPQDLSSSGQDITSASALPGTEPQEHTNQMPSHSVPRVLAQPWQLLSPAQVSPHQQSQSFPFPEPVLLHSFEFRQQPPCEDYPPQPTVPYLPLTPSNCMDMDSAEMNFCGPSNALPVWTPVCSRAYSPNIMPGVHGGQIGPQFDHPRHQQSHPLHGHQSPHLFAGPRVPGFHPVGPSLGASFGFGVSPLMGQEPGVVGAGFLPDGNGNIGALDRPKKAPVPSWLREELLKKKQAVGMSTTGVMSITDNFPQVDGPEEIVSAARKGVSDWPRSDSSGMSDNDYEDETQGARTAAINQEIKRVLTEILLRVTDDFFDEIAQELLCENKLFEAESLEQEETLYTSSTPSLLAAPALPVHARGLLVTVEENRVPSRDKSKCASLGAPLGNVLGLANYASDEDARRGQRWHSKPTDSETASQQNRRNARQGRSSDHGAGKTSKDLHGGQIVQSEESRDATPIQQLEQEDTEVLERGMERRGEIESKCQERMLKHTNKRKEQNPESKSMKISIEERSINDNETRSRRQTCRSEVQPVLLDTSLVGTGKVESAVSAMQCETNSVGCLPYLGKEKQSVGVVRPNQKRTVDVQSEVVELTEWHSIIFQGQERDAAHGRYRMQSGVAESGAYCSNHQIQNRLKDCDNQLNTTRVKERSSDQKWDEENKESHQKVNERDAHQGAYQEILKVEDGMERVQGNEISSRTAVKDGNERSRDKQRESKDKKRSRRQSSSSSSKVRSPSRSLSSGSHDSRSGGDKFKSPKPRCTHFVNKITSIH